MQIHSSIKYLFSFALLIIKELYSETKSFQLCLKRFDSPSDIPKSLGPFHFRKQKFLISELFKETIKYRCLFERYDYCIKEPLKKLQDSSNTISPTQGIIKIPLKKSKLGVKKYFILEKKPKSSNEKFPHLIVLVEIESRCSKEWEEFFRNYFIKKFYSLCVSVHEFVEFEQLIDGFIHHILSDEQISVYGNLQALGDAKLRLFCTIATREKIITVGLNRPRHFLYAEVGSVSDTKGEPLTWPTTSWNFRRILLTNKFIESAVALETNPIYRVHHDDLKETLADIGLYREVKHFWLFEELDNLTLDKLNKKYSCFINGRERLENRILFSPGTEYYFNHSQANPLDLTNNFEKLKLEYRSLLESENLEPEQRKSMRTRILNHLEDFSRTERLKYVTNPYHKDFRFFRLFFVNFILYVFVPASEIKHTPELERQSEGLIQEFFKKSLFELDTAISNLRTNIKAFHEEVSGYRSGLSDVDKAYRTRHLRKELDDFNKLTKFVSLKSTDCEGSYEWFQPCTLSEEIKTPHLDENEKREFEVALRLFSAKVEKIEELFLLEEFRKLTLQWSKNQQPGNEAEGIKGGHGSHPNEEPDSLKEQTKNYMDKIWKRLLICHYDDTKIFQLLKIEIVALSFIKNQNEIGTLKLELQNVFSGSTIIGFFEGKEKGVCEERFINLVNKFSEFSLNIFRQKNLCIWRDEGSAKSVEFFYPLLLGGKEDFEKEFGVVEKALIGEATRFFKAFKNSNQRDLCFNAIDYFCGAVVAKMKIRLLEDQNKAYLSFLTNAWLTIFEKLLANSHLERLQFENSSGSRDETSPADEGNKLLSRHIGNKSLRSLLCPDYIEITCLYKSELKSNPCFGIFPSDCGVAHYDHNLAYVFFNIIIERGNLSNELKELLEEKMVKEKDGTNLNLDIIIIFSLDR